MDDHQSFTKNTERLTASHLADVAQLEELCFAEPWSKSSLALLLGDGGVGFVVTEEGRAVAYGGMLTVLDEGQITNVAVHPERRRLGYGRRIAKALLAYAEERGLATVSLEVRESNAAAIALYREQGFAVCGKRRGFYRKPTEDALVMIWKNERV